MYKWFKTTGFKKTTTTKTTYNNVQSCPTILNKCLHARNSFACWILGLLKRLNEFDRLLTPG